ncbi:MAG: hypothetical protein JO108_09500 [Acidobacteriaceae bacterium]|nr:hypothetical protein [Acidobacteriaceae bacterium]
MYLFHIFRSLVPLRNPIGFGASDLLELGLALTALTAIFGYAFIGGWLRNFAQRTAPCMVAVFVLPIALRLALLPRASAPVAETAKEFSSLLLADTLLHGRIANPPHALSEFFEAPLVEQRPVYRSTLPMGDGFLLALGLSIFRNSWAGILLGVGALSALSYWMLRGWMAAEWALVGGVAVACAFGPLCGWANGYWGGFVVALGGCMIVGALPRLRKRKAGTAAVLGLGIVLGFLASPSAFCLFVPVLVLATMLGLKMLNRIRADLFCVIVILCAAHFVFWYGMHAFADRAALMSVSAYAGKNFVDDPERRLHGVVEAELNRQPGQQLVFVRRDAWHGPGEWIHNGADIDASKVAWARDLGPETDRKLIDYYAGGRKLWLLEPDAIPLRLRTYSVTSGPSENAR